MQNMEFIDICTFSKKVQISDFPRNPNLKCIESAKNAKTENAPYLHFRISRGKFIFSPLSYSIIDSGIAYASTP